MARALSAADAEAAFSRYSTEPAFPESPAAEWAQTVNGSREDALREIRGSLAVHLLEGGDPLGALGHFRAFAESEPLEEAWHRGVMRCHAHAGDIQRALRQYHACRSALRQAGGDNPGLETQALYMELLAAR